MSEFSGENNPKRVLLVGASSTLGREILRILPRQFHIWTLGENPPVFDSCFITNHVSVSWASIADGDILRLTQLPEGPFDFVFVVNGYVSTDLQSSVLQELEFGLQANLIVPAKVIHWLIESKRLNSLSELIVVSTSLVHFKIFAQNALYLREKMLLETFLKRLRDVTPNLNFPKVRIIRPGHFPSKMNKFKTFPCLSYTATNIALKIIESTGSNRRYSYNTIPRRLTVLGKISKLVPNSLLTKVLGLLRSW